MEAFADILIEGGRSNSLGRAGEVVDAVLADRARLDELWACIGPDDAYVRMRAIDSFEKVANRATDMGGAVRAADRRRTHRE